MPRDPRPHFLLPGVVTLTTAYQTPNRGGRPYATPPQDRDAHAASLRAGLANVEQSFATIRAEQIDAGWSEGFGLSVLFTSFPDVQLAIDSLEQRAVGVELLSVRETADGTLATVWIPDGKVDVFEEKIAAYLERLPRDNQKLIDAIKDIRTAIIEDLWTDEAPIPPDNQMVSFEVWISMPVIGEGRRGASNVPPEARLARFRAAATAANLRVSESPLRFPERAVFQVRGSLAQLRSSAHLLGQVAELRFAPESAEFFMGLPPAEQHDWANELLERTAFLPPTAETPYVCILDTGVAQGHPLLNPALDAADLHAVVPGWGVFDTHGHGTEQSGMALWGDLTGPMTSSQPLVIEHRLESVKIQPQDNTNADEHLGPITIQAISRPEINAPARRRLFSMAVTSTRTTLRGKPTAWSATVDALASDWMDNGNTDRLMIVSGGNVDHDRPGEYFSRNATTSIEDPAQAWNALTVGALTHKIQITDASMRNYRPMAGSGGLSPFSSCSVTWHREAPFKPDVVFEGGNLAHDGAFVSRTDGLSLLTTHHRHTERLLACSEATSAATALASRFSAQIMARYPAFWPQTVRALVVHSAEWSPELLRQFPASNKEDVEHRLRCCGWGEPNLDRALHSGADSLTLVVQGALQPFERRPARIVNGMRRGKSIGTRDMHLHKLPWPREALQALLAQEINLRVTLSYFVEPNPGERGRSTRFSYASHGLRFALQRPTETLEQFQQRVNRLARDAEEGFEPVGGGNPSWLLGPRRRFRGSLHHDRLTCTAAELAVREHVAVYPVGGWWKTREAQERFASSAKYSLVVSAHAPEIPLHVDLYTETEATLATIAVSAEIGTR